MKKVLIEIPDDHKRVIDNLVEDGKGYLLPHEVENRMALAIRNGKVLSEMTNGEVIKMMFPNGEYGTNDCFVHVYIPFNGIIQTMAFDLSWWNASYEEGEEQ